MTSGVAGADLLAPPKSCMLQSEEPKGWGAETGIDSHDQDETSCRARASEAVPRDVSMVLEECATGAGRLGLEARNAKARARRSLVIVARDQPLLEEHLKRQFASDPTVVVLMDRRCGDGSPPRSTCPGPERRRRAGYDHDVRLHWVVVMPEQYDPREVDDRAPRAISAGAAAIDDASDRRHAELRAAEREIARLQEKVVELRRELGRGAT